MTTELLELLSTMKFHAERERHAVKNLDARQLFELAAEGEELARRLARLLSRVSRDVVGTRQWSDICVKASEVRAIARANAELMRRSLEVIRAARPSYVDDAPAFVSRVA